MTVAPLDQFAEHLADGKSVTEAARLIGKSQQEGSRLLKRIKDALGRQAYG